MVSESHTTDDGPPTEKDRTVIRALAAELLDQLPALRDLQRLDETIHHVRHRDGELEFALSRIVPLEDMERDYVLFVLAQLGGNKTQAAEALGIDASTLYRKLNRWGR